MVLKNMRFFDIDFLAFFLQFLAILPGFWQAPGLQKISKIRKIDFLARSVLKEGSGRVLGEFWDGFGRILERFWTDFGWILERLCNDLFF